MPTLDDRLLPVFAGQHWLVTMPDIRAARGTPQAAATRVATGRWSMADRGVFRLNGVDVTWQSRLLAPILSTGGLAAASHHAAAALHGLPGFGRGAPEISIERGREHRRSDVIVHTSTDLDRCRIVPIDGIPTTDINRTLLDLGRTLSDRGLHRAIEAARRAAQTDWSELIATLAAHARKGRGGVRRLRRVISANADVAEATDSDLELLAIAVIAEAGLPRPVLHHRVTAGDRFVAEVDLAYPPLKIAIELDGSVHLQRDVRERDLRRQNDLVLEGWIVLRFTWDLVLHHPERVVAEVRAALRARGALAA